MTSSPVSYASRRPWRYVFPLLNLHPALGHRVVDRVLSHHAPEGHLGRSPEHGLWVTGAEEELDRVVDQVLDEELDVDDVLVAGQHQRLLGNRRAASFGRPEADLGATDTGGVDDLPGLDRPGQVIAEARLRLGPELTEEQDDSPLAGTDDVEARGKPEQQQTTEDQHAT